MNAICRIENHVIQCSCPYSFTGNQDVECVRSKYFKENRFIIIINYLVMIIGVCEFISYIITLLLVPRLCGDSGECDDSYVCKDSACVPRCTKDEECAFNERCSKGTCLCKFSLQPRCY